MQLKHSQYKGLIGFQVNLNHNQGYEKQQLTQHTDFFNRKPKVFSALARLNFGVF